ncbi:MAG TPA: NADPH:quinone oxidoreductase family protein [Burkholderiales bacterium]|jgi:NADPH2:quinone reductase|nr:NADPH:quinone oxidoreductase family protein [Burkholderiales bacterium]
MKAVLCKELGMPEKLVVEEVPSPKAAQGQVVVSVKACGVNFPDTLIIQGKYQFKPELPFSPGGEVAGVVKEVGEGVSRVKPGDRVIAFNTWGGFAEEIAVDAERTIPMPSAMDFIPASAFVLTYGTSYHALKDRADLKAGETLLVLGAAGGVGLAAIQLGKAMGAKVIAAASNDAKLQICKQNGADEVINYGTEDLRARIKAITAGKGVDVVYDPVGGPYSEPALRDMAWNGRFLVVGFAAGDIPKVPLNLTLLKGCSIVGVFWGAFTKNEPERNRENNYDLMAMYAAAKVRPHIHATYPLERAADALNEVIYKRVTGKVVLVTGR